MKKFLNIEVEGQGNIGVIDLGVIDPQEKKTKICKTIKERISPKLKVALEGHFDNIVNILKIEVVSHIGYIEARCKITVGEDEQEVYNEIAILKETWVY